MKELSCPLSSQRYRHIVAAHGSGGKLTQELLDRIIFPAFDNLFLQQRHDGAILPVGSRRVAFTSDSFVVTPLFFPGGNIGRLAVNGTVNDLLCCGAKPQYLSACFILEEGFRLDDFEKIVGEMAAAAHEAGVHIVTGDTKVVEHGKGDGVYINTAGIGTFYGEQEWLPCHVRKGDAIIVTGPLGEHGVCILSTRNHLGLESRIKSDTAALTPVVECLVSNIDDIHVVRDATRGGLGEVLCEIAEAARCRIEIEEKEIPVSEAVSSACELLGLDPLFVANEGVLVIILPGEEAESALRLIRGTRLGREARIIGRVTEGRAGEVVMRTWLGTPRNIYRASGEQLPRIC